jgi:hypothetical protein
MDRADEIDAGVGALGQDDDVAVEKGTKIAPLERL